MLSDHAVQSKHRARDSQLTSRLLPSSLSLRCSRRDSNPHALRRCILSAVCLPIPPQELVHLPILPAGEPGSPGSPRVTVQTQRIFHHTRHQISNEMTRKREERQRVPTRIIPSGHPPAYPLFNTVLLYPWTRQHLGEYKPAGFRQRPFLHRSCEHAGCWWNQPRPRAYRPRSPRGHQPVRGPVRGGDPPPAAPFRPW